MNRRQLTMKGFIFKLFLVLLFGFAFINFSWAADWGLVGWVNDGDTVVLTDGRHVRYIGINAPETGHAGQKAEPYGQAAKEYNEKLVLLKKVRLEFDAERYDQYGRTLAYVFLEDETFLNRVLLERGYAYCLPRKPNVRYDDLFLRLQQGAMSDRKGIWRNCEKKGEGVTGNRNSKRFHVKTCPFGRKIAPDNRILFSNQWDAFWAGYAPCKKCGGGMK